MKIQSINNNYLKYNTSYNLNTKYSQKQNSVNLATSSDISFNGISDFLLKLQAKMLEKEAYSTYKEASETRNDARNVLKKSTDAQKESLLICADAKVLYNDVQRILSEARKKGFPNAKNKDTGELIREFYDGDDGQFIMEEYNSKGETIRKTIISKDITLVIVKNKTTGKNDSYAFDTLNGELVEFSKNMRIAGDGYCADENYSYFDEELIAYDLSYKTISQNKETSKEHYAFCERQLDKHCTQWSFEKNISEKADIYYSYLNGILQKATIGLNETFGQFREASEEFLYDTDGGILSCFKDMHQAKNNTGTSTVQKMFKFSDFGLEKIYLGLSHFANSNKSKAKKMFRCAFEEIKGCAFNYEYYKNGDEKFERYVSIK